MMKRVLKPLAFAIFIMALMTTMSRQQTVYADMHGGGSGEPCPESGVWPAGCIPHTGDGSGGTGHSGAGQPCPTSGVWPAGCVPGGSGSSGSSGGGAGQPCPESGAWPASCVPGGSGSSGSSGGGAGQPCPTDGTWPAGCVPSGSAGSGGSGGSSGGSGAVCTPEWKFNVDWPCPTEEAQFGSIAEQPFENGRMIWVEATDTIYVLYNDGRQAVQFEDRFDGSVDPISDSSIAAPVGLRQPTYGFGKVWREQPGVRDKLGWALESELNTVGYIQEYSGNNDSGSYVSGADGFVWKISNVSAGLQWQKTTINNPN